MTTQTRWKQRFPGAAGSPVSAVATVYYQYTVLVEVCCVE